MGVQPNGHGRGAQIACAASGHPLSVPVSQLRGRPVPSRGRDEGVRPGFSDITYTVHVDSDADPEVLEEIKAAAERSSPMFDNVLNATPVAGRVVAAA